MNAAIRKLRRLSCSGRKYALLAALALCLPAWRTQADVTYQDTIRPLFQSSCLNCHNPDKNKAGLDLSTYDSTMDGSDNGKVVELGDADKSVLYKVLAHTQEPYMPKNGDKLPDSQLETIREWIQSNAPEKPGGAVATQPAGPAVAVVPVADRPKGPPAMPHDGLLEPVVHTMRAGAVPSIAGSPWAPLVALAAQEQVLLYDTNSLQLAAVLPFPEGFPAIVAFSRNGSLLIAGGGIGAKLGHVVVWDVVTGKRIIEIGDEFDTVLAADISPDQSLVALGGPSRLVKIFSAADGKMICKMKKHTDWVTALCFTPDGKELISGDRAGGLAVWDTEGHEVQSMTAHDAGITGIACRGNLVATCSEDGTVKFWDMVEGKQIKSWKAHDAGVRSIAFTADGQIVTSGRDRTVKLWDASGQQIRQFGPLNDIAMQACYAGGKIVASDWSGLVRAWTPDGKRAGDLDSNPPTIEQRIDMLTGVIASAEAAKAGQDQALKQATDTLADAARKETDAAAALSAAKAVLATAQGRLNVVYKQWATHATAIQAAQAEVGRLDLRVREIVWASGGNPGIEPAVIATAIAQMSAMHSLASQKAQLAQTTAALADARNRQAALVRAVEAEGRAMASASSSLKSAQTSLIAAENTETKTTARMNAANVDLVKWRAVEARMNSNPQYALRKTDGLKSISGYPR